MAFLDNGIEYQGPVLSYGLARTESILGTMYESAHGKSNTLFHGS